jgi:predicted phosphodiesterase
VELFARWPTHFVFGNVDYDQRALRSAIEAAGQTCHDRFGSLERAGKQIAWLHGDDGSKFADTLSSGKWDLICFGHTHVAETSRRDGTILLNPGALYRATPHSLAIVDLPELEVQIISL